MSNALPVSWDTTMAGQLFSLAELNRTCERIERCVGELDGKLDRQGDRLASMEVRMQVFEHTRPSQFSTARPLVIGGGGAGIVITVIEIAKKVMGW